MATAKIATAANIEAIRAVMEKRVIEVILQGSVRRANRAFTMT